ncbi:hypothetical protein [Nostoc sp. JL31]|nr:hypothetical protein [Nostoc sp. JL31]
MLSPSAAPSMIFGALGLTSIGEVVTWSTPSEPDKPFRWGRIWA